MAGGMGREVLRGRRGAIADDPELTGVERARAAEPADWRGVAVRDRWRRDRLTDSALTAGDCIRSRAGSAFNSCCLAFVRFAAPTAFSAGFSVGAISCAGATGTRALAAARFDVVWGSWAAGLPFARSVAPRAGFRRRAISDARVAAGASATEDASSTWGVCEGHETASGSSRPTKK